MVNLIKVGRLMGIGVAAFCLSLDSVSIHVGYGLYLTKSIHLRFVIILPRGHYKTIVHGLVSTKCKLFASVLMLRQSYEVF